MLAFLDSPFGLIVLFVAILLLFGPQKLPEIANQLGRALRELKRATSDLTSSVNLDSHHDSTYDPPHYDSYGNTHDSASSVPEEDVWQPTGETRGSHALNGSEPQHGDFAAAALADTAPDYGVSPTAPVGDGAPTYGVLTEAPKEITPRPAESIVPRS
jgi:TatA/E family protein of Tat protein translocase